jgi:hypothetical protein
MILILLETVIGFALLPIYVVMITPFLIHDHFFKPPREIIPPTEEAIERAKYLEKLDNYTKNNW